MKKSPFPRLTACVATAGLALALSPLAALAVPALGFDAEEVGLLGDTAYLTQDFFDFGTEVGILEGTTEDVLSDFGLTPELEADAPDGAFIGFRRAEDAPVMWFDEVGALAILDYEGEMQLDRFFDTVVDGDGVAVAFAMPDGETRSDTMAGGWTVNTQFATAKMPQEVMEAFEGALKNHVGAAIKPIAYLGSQVVAGSNYALLVQVVPLTAMPAPSTLAVAIVHAGVDGTVEFRSIEEIDVARYGPEPAQRAEGDMPGGWAVNADLAAATLPPAAQVAFDKAMEGLVGVGYEPLALLGSQVVAGTNFSVLCKATTVTAQPEARLSVVTVYQGPDGNAEVANVADFDIADYNV